MIMKSKKFIAISILSLLAIFISLFFDLDRLKTKKAENEPLLSVGDFLKNPVYDKVVKIYGEVSYLGERNQFRQVPDCPCFSLYANDGTVNVWYDSMKIFGPLKRPSVSTAGIKNGEKAVIIGELKSETKDREFKDFWVRKIEKLK